METVSIIAAAMGIAWASGINLYAAVVMLGLMGNFDYIDLPADLELLEHPGVLLAAGTRSTASSAFRPGPCWPRPRWANSAPRRN